MLFEEIEDIVGGVECDLAGEGKTPTQIVTGVVTTVPYGQY